MAAKRGNQKIRDMVLSMLVIGAVVAGVYTVIPHNENADPLKTVDYRVELSTAQRSAPYPVLAPQGLSKEWRATSVTYRGNKGKAWHLGFLDPEKEYVAVEQSTNDPAKYVPEVTLKATNTGKTQQVGGAQWQVWKGEKYDALVRTDKDATTVVLGTAKDARLAEMAAALKAKPTAPTPSPANPE
ncbi:DUF4245 domain-containing protein [Streptomyces sp. NBC_00237]|uniref:DUF4245 domain-containing protein n=1 Tax=Streptomyces sp. NBC_00237 TaxID=2975687 RepID=UPI002251415D|nr:DUF4245 domain-containing protein [Streptomyces sp. NBC_00237]MCX5204469.1 DUF4245 domain-containing protein [Streptomyces sp. NBC_00237]